MAKYRFRVMYFICADKKILSPEIKFTNAYQYKEDADIVCKESNIDTRFIWELPDKPIAKRTVEAFYLVPEKLYNEVLKKYVEGD